MTYSKTAWKDRVVEKPLTYTMHDNGDGTITLTPAPGTVTEVGTPVNAGNMNKIEQGILDAVAKSGDSMTGPLQIRNWANYSANDGGLMMMSDNAYLHPTDGTFRFKNTHASLGAHGIIIDWSQSSSARKLSYFVKTGATTGDAIFTLTWDTDRFPIWHGGSDGAGSGMDADLLDGVQGTNFMPVTSHTNANEGADLNSFTSRGFYRSVNASANLPSGYTLGTNDFHILVQDIGDSSWLRQTLLDVRSQRAFFRSRLGGTWNPWVEVWSEDKLRWNATYQTMEYLDGGVWKPVGAMFATKTKGSFNTLSTTPVTALSLTGPGRLVTLSVRGGDSDESGGYPMQLTVIADGVTVFNTTSQIGSPSTSFYQLMPHLVLQPAINVPFFETDISFRSSLVVQVTAGRSSTPTYVEYAYQQ